MRTLYGCFHELGVDFVGVLIISTFIFVVDIRASDFSKFPYGPRYERVQ